MSQYFVHNGYAGWAYGTPSDPQLVSAMDASRLMELAGLTPDQVVLAAPPAQYADSGDKLFKLTRGNRFLFLGDVACCTDVAPDKVTAPLVIDWAVA